MFYKKRLAITLAEILIGMVIIGAIAITIIPILKKTLPSKEEKMHKKMTYLVEQIVAQMYDNESYYPRSNDPAKFGFQNTDQVTVDGVQYGGTGDDAQEKFCRLFAHHFNKVTSDSSVTCPGDIETFGPSFRSSDGVDWWIPATTFKESEDGRIKGVIKIKVDVNGTNHGDNCIEGNCKNPDIFYYYIKTNGSVTLANPQAIADGSYEIIVNKITKDENGNETEANGGTVKIAPLDASGSVVGDYSDEASKFKNLRGNSSYMLNAIPSDGYVSSWSQNIKKVNTNKPKKEVTVIFSKLKRSCIKLKVDCSKDSIMQCVDTYKYKYNCSYTACPEDSPNCGEYDLEEGNYNYKGSYQGSYKYSCTNSADLSSDPDDASKLQVCNLAAGDYSLHVTPKDGMYIVPQTNENVYNQDVRLGNVDQEFEVEIEGADCDLVIGNLCVKVLGRGDDFINTCDDDEPWNYYHSSTPIACQTNRWEAAKRACSYIGMNLPSLENLEYIFHYRYNEAVSCLHMRFWSSKTDNIYSARTMYFGSTKADVEELSKAAIEYIMCVKVLN